MTPTRSFSIVTPSAGGHGRYRVEIAREPLVQPGRAEQAMARAPHQVHQMALFRDTSQSHRATESRERGVEFLALADQTVLVPLGMDEQERRVDAAGVGNRRQVAEALRLGLWCPRHLPGPEWPRRRICR